MSAPAAVAVHYRRSRAALWRRTVDGVLVFPPSACAPVEVTGPGSEVWTLLESDRTPAEIASALADRFGVPAGEIEDLLGPLLADLVRMGAVEVHR